MDEFDMLGLKQALAELEQHKEYLKRRFGPDWLEIQANDGTFIATPIITALVNGYAAMHGINLK
jgi:hypothetical protein